MNHPPYECPSCKANLKDGDGSQVIGIVQRDYISDWRCPECGYTWERMARKPTVISTDPAVMAAVYAKPSTQSREEAIRGILKQNGL